MSLYSILRFKWRVRRSILALQSAGYVTLPFDGTSVLAFHWANPQNRILFQPSRADVRLGQVFESSSRSVVRLGQVTCYPGSLVNPTSLVCRLSPVPYGNGRSPSEDGSTSTRWASYAL